MLPLVTNVGYHYWLHDTLLALFLVGQNNEPHALAIVGTGEQRVQRIATSIGRTLQLLPDGRLAFVQKAAEQTWYIKTYDPLKKTVDILVKTPPGTEDFAVLSDGTLLSSAGSKLLQLTRKQQTDWVEIADLSRYGVKKFPPRGEQRRETGIGC